MNLDRDHTRLLQILKYTTRILTDLTKFKNAEELGADYRNVDLLSFWLLQIAENASNLSDDYRSKHNNLPWRELIRFRSIPAHHYESLNVGVLWNIVTNEVPILHEFAKQQEQSKKSRVNSLNVFGK